MATTTVSRRPISRFFEVRVPALYYGLAGVWAVFAFVPWIDPAFVGGTGRAIAISVVGGVAAVLLAAAATFTVMMRRRRVWTINPTPQAQESDPRLR